MATLKAFISLGDDIILPITRGELVFDSKGKIALHSEEFLATETIPGLISAEEKKILAKVITTDDFKVDQLPIESSPNLVTSGGVWKHVDNTLGEIDRILITI